MKTPAITALAVGLLVGFDWPGQALREAAPLAEEGPEAQARAVRRLAIGPRKEARPGVLEALSDPSAEVRAEAAHAAARLVLREAQPSLERGLGARDARVRAACARALGALGEVRSVPPLMRALKDPELVVRIAAIETLADLGDARAIPGLVEALDDSAAAARVQAVRALRKLAEPSTTLSLVGMAEDPAPEVRAEVMRALASLGDARALTTFLRALDDDAPEVALRAAHGVGSTGAPEALEALVPRVHDAGPRMARAALAAMASLATSEALARMIEGLAQPPLRDMARAAFAEALRRTPELQSPAADLLTDALQAARDPGHARGIAQVIVENRLATATPRQRAALLSAYDRLPRARVALLPALAAWDDDRVRWRLLESTETSDPQTDEALLAALEDNLPAGMGLAADPLINWLPHIGDALVPRLLSLIARTEAARVAPSLTPYLTSSDPQVRSAALDALTRLVQDDGRAVEEEGGLPSLDPIRKLFADTHPSVAHAAGRAFGALAKTDSLSSLVDEYVVASKRRGSTLHTEALVLALVGLLERGAEVEGKSRRGRLRQSLERTIFETGSDTAAVAALEAARAWHTPVAQELLRRVGPRQGTARRLAALRALARTEGAAARDMLQRWAEDTNEVLAAEALVALAPHVQPSDRVWLDPLVREGTWPVGPNAAFLIHALASSGDEAVPQARLCELAASDDPHVSANGLSALAQRGVHSCAQAAALRALRGPDDVRARAARRWAEHAVDTLGVETEARHALKAALESAQRRPTSQKGPEKSWASVQMTDGSVLLTHPDALGRRAVPPRPTLVIEPPWYAPFY